MKHYIKTGLVRFAVHVGVAIATVSIFGMAHASEYVLTTTAAPQSVQAPTVVISQAPQRTLRLHDGAYMKTTYRDFKVRLVGPFNITVDDDHIQQRFTNLNSFRAQRVRSPYETNAYTAPSYYRSTIAKTGFKFKF